MTDDFLQNPSPLGTVQLSDEIFGIEAKSFLKGLKIWIMRRLRSLVWKQWKNPKTRVRNLEKLGIAHHDAMLCGNARKKYWHMSKIKWVPIAMPERYFIDKGLYLPGN